MIVTVFDSEEVPHAFDAVILYAPGPRFEKIPVVLLVRFVPVRIRL